jgi:hypothetical protein
VPKFDPVIHSRPCQVPSKYSHDGLFLGNPGVWFTHKWYCSFLFRKPRAWAVYYRLAVERNNVQASTTHPSALYRDRPPASKIIVILMKLMFSFLSFEGIGCCWQIWTGWECLPRCNISTMSVHSDCLRCLLECYRANEVYKVAHRAPRLILQKYTPWQQKFILRKNGWFSDNFQTRFRRFSYSIPSGSHVPNCECFTKVGRRQSNEQHFMHFVYFMCSYRAILLW